ncbi:MAG TPA: carbohydrate ABC transporter permease [Candidatus Pelethocola excrementipullorum]|nr:carbohydrate ABC transporter permease [Candidatus Pelethocola excrementipullorum]
MRRIKASTILANIAAWIASLMILVPMIVVLLNSFKTQKESVIMDLSLPKKLMFENYGVVIERGKLLVSFMNSAIYACFSVILIVIGVAAASYVLSRNRSKLHKVIYYFMILGIAMPLNNVALMKIMKATSLINTRYGLIFLYTAINIPLALFLMFGFVETVPREIDEAAVIDGATSMSMFLKVILPLMKPVIVTVGILNFMSIWNDFSMPLYFMNNSGKWPMTLAVYNFFGQFEQSWNLVSADIVLTAFPVLMLFVFGQKYIVGGVSSGAVKG